MLSIRISLLSHQVYQANEEVQQRGRQKRLQTLESRQAGPVCCNGWFGSALLHLVLQ
jgi:hypothetical protein